MLRLELLYSCADRPELNFEKYVTDATLQVKAEDQNEEIEESARGLVYFAYELIDIPSIVLFFHNYINYSQKGYCEVKN